MRFGMVAKLAVMFIVAVALGAAIPSSGTLKAAQSKAQPALAGATAFGRLPPMGPPAISPDGRRLVARGRSGDREIILVIDTSGEQFVTQRLDIPDGHRLHETSWAGNSRLLVALSRLDNSLGPEIRVARLMLIDLATGAQRRLGPDAQGIDGDNVIFIDPAGAFILLSTRRTTFALPSVLKIDLATNRMDVVVRPVTGVQEWFADSAGVVRAGLGFNGRRLFLVYRDAEGESFSRTSQRDFDTETFGIDRLWIRPGTSQGYAIARRESGRFGVYGYDFRTDTIGAPLFEHPRADVTDFDLDNDGKPIFATFEEERPMITWFDDALARTQQRLDRALPGAVNRILSLSLDKGRAVVLSMNDRRPPTYFVLDRRTGNARLLASPYAWLAERPLATMTPVRYRARDGLEIPGYLSLPPGRGERGLPLVMLVHGGPFSRDSWGFDPWVQFLTGKGYAVLQPNFRGSTGYGKGFVDRATGQYGRAMQDDLDDGVRWLAERGTIDPKRVCIMGASYGGYAAMWGAARNPEIYRCAISFAGVSDVPAQLRHSARHFIATRYFRDWRDRLRGEAGFDLASVSPLSVAARIGTPLLIAHGSKDEIVPPAQSRRMHDALTRAGKRHEFVIYEGEGHGLRTETNSIDFLRRVDAFLDAHNLP